MKRIPLFGSLRRDFRGRMHLHCWLCSASFVCMRQIFPVESISNCHSIDLFIAFCDAFDLLICVRTIHYVLDCQLIEYPFFAKTKLECRGCISVSTHSARFLSGNEQSSLAQCDLIPLGTPKIARTPRQSICIQYLCGMQ